MPRAESLGMHFIWVILFGAAVSAPAYAEEGLVPEAGPARCLPGRYLGFEPSVAGDPTGAVLIVAMNHVQDKLTKHPQLQPLLAWRSIDRGETWSEPRLMGSHPMADVWLQADPRGGFLAAYLENVASAGNKGVFRRSEDGGQTWTGERVVGGIGADKTVLAISPSGKYLAVAFIKVEVAALVRSDDRGEQWQKIPRVGVGGVVDYAHWITGLAVNDDGAIVASWTLGGAKVFLPRDPKSVRKLVVSTTKDAGKTWTDLQIASYADSQVEAWYLDVAPGVALALGGSAVAHAVCCYPHGDKKDYRVLYRRSADLEAWSDPVSLAVGAADDFRGFPAVAAAGERVHVTWMERSGELYNVWYRGSADGGKSWSKPVRLSCPDRPTELLTAEGFKHPGGHYMSLAEDGKGTAHAAWGVGSIKGVTGGEIWHCAVRLRPEEGPVK